MKTKKNQTDSTLRNVKAANKKLVKLESRIQRLEITVKFLKESVTLLLRNK